MMTAVPPLSRIMKCSVFCVRQVFAASTAVTCLGVHGIIWHRSLSSFIPSTPVMKTSRPTSDGYDPGRLLTALRANLERRSDNGLARSLEVPGPLIQKVRSGEIPVTPELLIRMEEVSGWSARQLRDMMGDRRAKFRFEQVRNSPVGEMISEIYALADAKKIL